MNLEKIIDTDNSRLSQGTFEDTSLLEECVKYIRGKLNEYPPIKIYDKICHQRRCVGFFSDESIGYYYSNQLSKSKPMSPCLLLLLETINSHFDYNYNGILVNLYKTGDDYISAHSDDETGLDKSGAGVVAISYGATRKFRIRDKKTREKIIDIPMTSGLIIKMDGDFQKKYTHEVPIERRVKEERISFTFRKHNK